MTRTFESGPAIAPDGPLQDPPAIEERLAPTYQPAQRDIDDDRVRRHLDEGQLTVGRLIQMLQLAIVDNAKVIDFVVNAEGCDCVGEACGIEIDLDRGDVLVSREKAGR